MSIYRMSINTNTKPKRKKKQGEAIWFYFTQLLPLILFLWCRVLGIFRLWYQFSPFSIFFKLIWLYFHSIKIKKKEKNSNRHYYGCGREVVYASEWFFLFNAMVDDKERLNRVATK